MDKSTLLNHLSSAGEILERSDTCASQLSDVLRLVSKLNEKQLVVSVFGQFKRGKSTLINSILKEEILPVGIIPVTSVVTKIVYGDKSAAIHFGEDTRKIDFEELSEYINEQRNPNNVKNVTSVTISYPSDFLKSGILLVDTPGVGSIHKHNTEVAYSYVKESDAVIFLLSVDSPINEIESEFLNQIKQYISKIYFAVNKIDLISEKDLADYLSYCSNVICDLTSADSIRLFPISARSSSDAGTGKLIAAIMTDMRTEGEDILCESVRIKLAEKLNEAIALLKLKQNVLQMPVKKLEKASALMEEKITALDEISKETVYLMNQKTDFLIERLRDELTSRKDSITSRMVADLKKIYERDKKIRTKEFENALKTFISNDAAEELRKLNEYGIELLKQGYEDITKAYDEKLFEIHSILNETIKALFGENYPFAHGDYELSEKSDYYIRLNEFAFSFLFDVNDFIFLLPNAKANKILYNRYEEKLKEDVMLNITNMLSDYSYKLRESKRMFNSRFSENVTALSNTFGKFMNQTLQERSEMELRHTNLAETLQNQLVDLEKSYNEIKGQN